MSQEKRLLAVALKRKEQLQRLNCIDPHNLNSRPTARQQVVLDDIIHLLVYVVAGNQSGKSSLGGRIVAWKFEENHPKWERPNSKYCHICKSDNFTSEVHKGVTRFQCEHCGQKWLDWGNEPLLILVAGRVGAQVMELWRTKIEPFLEPDCYKVDKIGKVIQSVEHKKNGNKIIFTSHDKASESWTKVQSYVAHHVWLDEMPSDHKYIEELQRRVDAKMGQFFATFTPKSRNLRITKMVDGVDPSIGIKYKMGKFDNPIYHGREEEERAKIKDLSPEDQANILEGDWLGITGKVFTYEPYKHTVELPENYTRDWAHVLAIDPAASGMAGLIVAAQDPSEKRWIIIKAMYLEGKAPSDLVIDAEKEVIGLNVVRRVYDPKEAGFMKEAVKLGLTYNGVYNKSQRKGELITNLQEALKDGWLQFLPHLSDMKEEFDTAEWQSGVEDKIKNSTKYHLLDAMQYLVDNLPKIEPEKMKLSRDAALLLAHQLERQAEQEARENKKGYRLPSSRDRFAGRRICKRF